MEADAAPTDPTKMTKLQKLATLLVLLGPDSAAQMLKGMEEKELEAVTGEMARLPVIGNELQHQILEEFAGVAVEVGAALSGGVNFVKVALQKSSGRPRINEIPNRVAPAKPPPASALQISEMEPQELFNLLKREQPQTIALVASYLSPAKCSDLLMLLRSDLRDWVVERLATLEPTPVEVVERVMSVLRRRAGGKSIRAMNHTGGLKNAADVLNSIEKNLSQSVLMELEKRNPELGRAIRDQMFTFDDLALLDSQSLQKLMREADMRDLAVSLKFSGESVRHSLLSSISRHAAEIVREEISLLGPLSRRQIEAAQTRLVEAARQLECRGEIVLGAAPHPIRDEILV